MPRRRLCNEACARYVALDGADKLAIVVCADIAEYARGSSGESTQGAGAVAMLLEREPKMLARRSGARRQRIDYRAADFRKPLRATSAASLHGQIRDFPIFNGKYSTSCYLDETLLAMADMFAGMAASRRLLTRAAAFLHRPYRRMAEQWLAELSVRLAHGGGAAAPSSSSLRAREQAGRERARGDALAAEHPSSSRRQQRRRTVPAQLQLRSVPRQPLYQRASARQDAVRHPPCRSAATSTPPRCRAGSPPGSKTPTSATSSRRAHRSSRSVTAAATPPKWCR